MVDEKNLETRTEEETRKATNIRHLKKVSLGIVAFVALTAAGWGVATYFYITASHEYKIKQGHEYCQQLNLNALDWKVNKYYLERTYPPNSKYNCAEIEQQYRGF